MKKRIRLGISSMSNCVKYISQPSRSTRSSTSSVSNQDSYLSDLSSSDLDDMFATNLRLLQDLEKKKTGESNNVNGRHFQSSLSIYISPHIEETFDPPMEHSNCDIIRVLDKRLRNNQTSEKNNNNESKRSSLNRSKIYSSYEVLYDKLLYGDQEAKKERDWECMSQSMIENPKSNFLKIGSSHSTDSDGTLKSASSNNSSPILFQKSDPKLLEITGSNQSLPKYFPMSNEVHMNMNAKLRQHQNGHLSRPSSCYMSDSVGYNCTDKPPSYPSNNTNENRTSRSNLDGPSNIIASRSLKTLSLTPHNDFGKTVAVTNDLDFYRKFDQNSNLSISSRSINNNIINNQMLNSPRCSSSFQISNNGKTNVSQPPPIVPPRTRSSVSKGKILNGLNQTNGESPVLTIQNHNMPNINANKDLRESTLNDVKSRLKTQNYDNEFSYPRSRTNSVSHCTIFEIRRKSQK